MAYELTITPSRGFVILQASGANIEGNVMFNNASGPMTVEDRLSKTWSNSIIEYTVGNATQDGAIAFNNATLQNTTQITLNATANAGSGIFIFYNHIALFKGTNFEQYALFKINNVTNDASFRSSVLDVNFVSSTVGSYANNDKIVLIQSNKISQTPYNYLATPSNPVTAIGGLKAINAILQTPASVVWSEKPNAYDVVANGGVNNAENVRKTPSDTSDVTLVYQVKKNGVLHQTFNIVLEYKP